MTSPVSRSLLVRLFLDPDPKAPHFSLRAVCAASIWLQVQIAESPSQLLGWLHGDGPVLLDPVRHVHHGIGHHQMELAAKVRPASHFERTLPLVEPEQIGARDL